MSDLTWAEKVRRVANAIQADGLFVGDREQAERIAENALVAVGDANQ